MHRIIEVAAKYWPSAGNWLIGAIAVIVTVQALKMIGVPVEQYVRTGTDRIFEFLERDFPAWPYLIAGILIGRLIPAARIIRAFVITRNPPPADPEAEVRRLKGKVIRFVSILIVCLILAAIVRQF